MTIFGKVKNWGITLCAIKPDIIAHSRMAQQKGRNCSIFDYVRYGWQLLLPLKYNARLAILREIQVAPKLFPLIVTHFFTIINNKKVTFIHTTFATDFFGVRRTAAIARPLHPRDKLFISQHIRFLDQ